jgi:hypothetical protein
MRSAFLRLPPNPFKDYLATKDIRLLLVRDTRLEKLIVGHAKLERICRVQDHIFYYAPNKT